MAKKKKIITIGQLKYLKRQKDLIMKKLLDSAESEGIKLSITQLKLRQRDAMKKISIEHGNRVRCGKNHAKLKKEQDKSEL